MASKVPKFGAWEGGENYTVCFENARKTKNGPMINPNDPEENPDMFRRNGAPAQAPSPQRKADPQGQQSKLPQFGAWDNGDNVGYTVYFENTRKAKNDGPTMSNNEPCQNRHMNPRGDPPAKVSRATTKPEPQEARSKVPQFGAWEGGGDVPYTMCFDNARKNKNGTSGKEEPSNAPQLNRVVPQHTEPPAQEALSKSPQFGAWEEGENVAYTAYFDNPRKNKNVGPTEPQLNRDIVDRPPAQHPPGATRARFTEQPGQGGGGRARFEQGGNKEGQLRNTSRGSTASGTGTTAHPKGGKPQVKPAGRGSQTPERGATIPPFGVWNTDPEQAENITVAFERAKVEKMTPLNKNAPASYNHNQTHQSNQQQKKGCCFAWFP